MHLKSDSTEIMINQKSDEVIEKRFEALLNTIILDCKHQ